MAWKDPYGGLQNPYFLELQQKNVAAGENCPYVTLAYDDDKQNKAHKYIQANMCKSVKPFLKTLIPIYYEPIKGLATTIINY